MRSIRNKVKVGSSHFLTAALWFCALGSGVLSASAQIQEAWVTRYNNGLSNRQHQAVAMALHTNGNIYVTGSSQSGAGDFDYVTLKYSPYGAAIWTNRFATTLGDGTKAMALDRSGNVVVTGSGGTVKYASNGAQLWTAPYTGRSVAIDPSDNIVVTGFSSNDFATAKLNPMGTNLWVRTYNYGGTDISERVIADSLGNIYVAGRSAWDSNRITGEQFVFATIKYDASGNEVWVAQTTMRSPAGKVDVAAIDLDGAGDIYVTGSRIFFYSYTTWKFQSSTGSNLWYYSLEGWGGYAQDAVVDSDGLVYLTGDYGTVKLDHNGAKAWRAGGDITGRAIAIDPDRNVYAAGIVADGPSANDIVSSKYDSNGHKLWVKRYNGPANGNDEAKAIAVDTAGSVYVAGTSANTNGGTDIVLIKYAELQTIQLLTNQNVCLQFFGTPGQSYRFQASTNLPNWQDIGSSIADSNGIYRFEETTAASYPQRFYRTVTP